MAVRSLPMTASFKSSLMSHLEYPPAKNMRQTI
jgi:hypothetical protein